MVRIIAYITPKNQDFEGISLGQEKYTGYLLRRRRSFCDNSQLDATRQMKLKNEVRESGSRFCWKS